MAEGSVVAAKKIVNTDVVLEQFDLKGLEFRGCALAQFEHPLMAVVRRGTLSRCKAVGCSVHGVRFEEIVAENITFSKPMNFAACTFRQVRLEGRIGAFLTTPPHYSLSEEVSRTFVDAMVSYYRDVDWALDISGAEFSDASLYMVPGDLVRRNEETQFLLRRSVFEAAGDGLPSSAASYRDRFSRTPFDSFVEIAPVRSKYFREFHEELTELRRLGLAE
ncbi:hypothetical protein ABZ464_03070 [Streptomyces sp. NPDC005820]|uniref:hypothetical protein n=1 Tax=Streptomyces sp. NPDC005820 TaxID=3157069 RepID=UPI0033EF770D